MKNTVLSNLTKSKEEITAVQISSIEEEKRAEIYASNILAYVSRKELYMDCCEGMYYA
jgi:hypothetical protein